MQAAAYDYNDMDPFFRDVGELQAKFLGLEYWIRTFLFRHAQRPFIRNLDSIVVGDVLDANEFTNYDTLGQLIDKYNKVVGQKDPALAIDRRIIDIRDALAHGRIHRKTPETPPRLLKFSKVDKATGTVRVETDETLDPAKLQSWNTYLFMMTRRVLELCREPAVSGGV